MPRSPRARRTALDQRRSDQRLELHPRQQLQQIDHDHPVTPI